MPRLSDCIKGYLLDCYALTESTQALYGGHLWRLVVSADDPDVEDVDAPLLRLFMANLRQVNGEKYSPAYEDQVYRTLTTFFRWLVREDTLLVNPLDKVRRPRVPKRKSPRLALDQIGRLISTVAEMKHSIRNLAIICLMLDSGLRRNEVLELGVESLDLPARTAKVFDCKTKTEREVPLGSTTIETLRAYARIRPPGGDALFVTSKGKPLTAAGLQTLMYRLKETTGIPSLRCHLLRHTFANHYIAGGGGLRQLQSILGHADIKTTAGIYTDPELKDLQQQHDRVSPLAQIRRKGGK